VPGILLYGKPGCCLCDDGRRVLGELGRDRGFAFTEVDVSLDPALHRRYGERIPVVEIDGEIACELGVDAAAVEARLDRLTR
jgi:hypothetical protein